MRECRSLVVLDWKIKIDKCREDLSNDLSFDLISPALIQMRIISSDEYAKIRDEMRNEGRIKELLKILQGKDEEEVFDRFIDYLRSDYDWLATQLENTPVVQADRDLFAVKMSQTSGSLSTRLRSSDSSVPLLLEPSLNSSQHIENGMPPFSPSNISILSSSSSSRPCPSSETSPHSRINHISVPCSSPRAPCSSPQVPSCSGPQVPPCSSPRVPASPSLTRSGSSPLHSSDLSIFSSQSDHSTQEMPALTKVGEKRRREEEEGISEEIIEYVSRNPMIMTKWQNLAHQVGLSSLVPVIKARIRQDGRDYDEHISEFIREWTERNPGEATVRGLICVLRKLRFNDTAGRIEDGSFRKKMK
ncbi:uncharacterized protein LOC111713371 [Eurytemora carolleeae]|uniref:uncharacterized protein LOC111713371 n=1 Tax=Eurytemora carolleeae TaxID=1294199 RepID=UPI000C765CAA|nr:uncharacterized protein LOC111713371 [Eurytemora carolleeae]|eukprot:XP_023343992.1 uncharacterized protein LOC111713371 [Eurytemora affinis]